jgi:hypothetical protein
LIAATGFILFAVPGTEGSYWTTFFATIVVLGLGMSLVIASLTTTAMNSVEGRHSGLAFGVNNAVSRAAGLLAIPILGIFVFLAFSAALDAQTASLDLSPQARQQLEAEKVDLGVAEVPEGVGGETAADVKQAVAKSFVAGFRVAMVAAAILAVASAAASALIYRGQRQRTALRARDGSSIGREVVALRRLRLQMRSRNVTCVPSPQASRTRLPSICTRVRGARLVLSKIRAQRSPV